MTTTASEGGSNFWDTLGTVLPVAITAISGTPQTQTVTPTGGKAISTNTLLLIGGGVVAVVVAVLIFK